MTKILSLICIGLFLLSCNNKGAAPGGKDKSAVKAQAEKMASSLMKKDYKTFAGLTYPKVVEMMGGEAKMAEVMETNMSQMEASGTHFAGIKLGEPSEILTEGKELQCTIPQTVEMKVPEGKLVKEATLIAVSWDNGESWYFLDTSGKNITEVKNAFSNISDKLVLPASKEATLIKS